MPRMQCPEDLTNLLDDMIVVVLGPADDLGLAIAGTFIEHGAQVVAVGPGETGHAPSYGITYLLSTGAFIHASCDIDAPGTAERVSNVVEQRYGRIDVLVNNWAGEPPADRGSRTDMQHVARLTGALLPLMTPARNARIINIGTILSRDLSTNGEPAVISNHPLIELTRTQALEYGRSGVTANSLLCGGVAGPGFQHDETTVTSRRFVEARCPLHRVANPREIAATALFLASPLSSYVNGQVIVADGGMSLNL